RSNQPFASDCMMSRSFSWFSQKRSAFSRSGAENVEVGRNIFCIAAHCSVISVFFIATSIDLNAKDVLDSPGRIVTAVEQSFRPEAPSADGASGMVRRSDQQPTQIKPSCEQALAQSAPAPAPAAAVR